MAEQASAVPEETLDERVETLEYRLDHLVSRVDAEQERQRWKRERDLYLALGYLAGIAVAYYCWRRY